MEKKEKFLKAAERVFWWGVLGALATSVFIGSPTGFWITVLVAAIVFVIALVISFRNHLAEEEARQTQVREVGKG